jgi:pyrimidine-specific ribonucleoside hydrolase
MRFSRLTCFTMAVVLVMFAAVTIADEHAGDPKPTKGERTFHILKDMPLDASSYQPATAALVTLGVPEKFGHEEWAAIVLTNEVHQHVGIYSILGAKMGVRAKEILDAPPRAVQVTVETGGKPPMSCMIDGLQVALGSTFAQDLIHAPASDAPSAAAVFEYKGRKIRLALKPEVQKRIAGMIDKAVKECGDLTPAYFQRIETFSYSVWAEFDRSFLFDEETVQPGMERR